MSHYLEGLERMVTAHHLVLVRVAGHVLDVERPYQRARRVCDTPYGRMSMKCISLSSEWINSARCLE